MYMDMNKYEMHLVAISMGPCLREILERPTQPKDIVDQLIEKNFAAREISKEVDGYELCKKITHAALRVVEDKLEYRWPALGQTEREILMPPTVRSAFYEIARLGSRLSGRPWKPGLGPAFVLGA